MAATQLSSFISQGSRTLSRLPSLSLGDRGCPFLVPFLRRLEATPFSLITTSIFTLQISTLSRSYTRRTGPVLSAWNGSRLTSTFPHRSISCLLATRSSSAAVMGNPRGVFEMPETRPRFTGDGREAGFFTSWERRFRERGEGKKFSCNSCVFKYPGPPHILLSLPRFYFPSLPTVAPFRTSPDEDKQKGSSRRKLIRGDF
ncbi:hypothetical protein KSP40_PGU021721 [Platanthera guangdongensis]|uniref:Uncharacterized protein n=1 Tax=Platanthera guangdongensis TaxID=2320717 RepID=A0ABR2MFD0_9ASPA